MKVRHLPIWIIRGATAYEVQVWRLCLRFVYRKYWSKWLDQSLPYFRRKGPRLPTIEVQWAH